MDSARGRDLERLTNEKLAIYNQVLKEQLFELKSEIDALACHPRSAPIVVVDDFDIEVRTAGPAEAHRLDIMIRDMETSLALMRNGDAEKEVRLAIKEYRAAIRMRARFERDCPFEKAGIFFFCCRSPASCSVSNQSAPLGLRSTVGSSVRPFDIYRSRPFPGTTQVRDGRRAGIDAGFQPRRRP
jgi:hypothetical protein